MGTEREEGYEDKLEKEIYELEAFIHKKGLEGQLDLWRRSADYDGDLEEYGRLINEQAEEIDEGNKNSNNSNESL